MVSRGNERKDLSVRRSEWASNSGEEAHKSENVHPRLGRRVRLDGLVEDGQVVDAREHDEHEEEGRDARADGRPVGEEVHGQEGGILLADVPLPADEEHEDDTEDDELGNLWVRETGRWSSVSLFAKRLRGMTKGWTNDRRSVPRLRDPTLLQSEDKTRRDSKDEDRSNPVEREEPPKGRLGGQAGSLLFRFELSKSLGSARSDKEDDGHESDASNGQIQVEAPSPRRMLGENAAEEGADLEVGARKRVREARISFRRKEELQHATRTTLETAKTAPNPPNMAGRFWRGTISAMMERTPEVRGGGEICGQRRITTILSPFPTHHTTY